MKQLKCPNCGKVFQVDEADYASIVSQIKNAEFDAEVDRRLAEIHERHKAEQELATAKTEQSYQKQLNDKDLKLSEKESEIVRLKNQLENIEAQKKSELTLALAEKDRTITQLNSTIEQSDSKMQLAVMEERGKAQQAVQQKDKEIARLLSSVESERSKAQIQEAALVKRHQEELRMKQDLVDYYKDLKTKMSTKMVGETLEQHCEIQFNQLRPTAFRNAYFEKDNDAKTGSKGDYIYRETDENGTEIISIMFEMKNEMDETATKHKNEDFLKELDKDRREKNCEYAVLVSLLEADSELYNGGIVDVSHRYDKMYVVRPQCFIPIITLLRNAAMNALMYKQELALVRNQNIDITNFEDNLLKFKDDFGRNYSLAHDHFDKAIEEIDKTISHLEKVKKELLGSDNQLRIATGKVEDISVKKLTKNNPTMQAEFEKVRKG